MKFYLGLLPAIFLVACAGTSSPSWLLETDAALSAYHAAYLNGNERVAARELALARREVGRTGDAMLMARVELSVCAAQTASLAGTGCPAFTPLATDAGDAERAYAAYLAGESFTVDQLPASQRQAWTSGQTSDLAAIADPLSRLVAAGVLWRHRRLADEGYALATETAAGQGWRRALLAWLAADRERLLAKGDVPSATSRQRRIERIVDSAR
ncbi:MAG: hypothetical protein CVU34_03890 [Betaproteobacteria bacterium HGW-Betaproteobacteria-7]|jgi:hypothetical protein|nr:MAG: hypothetical protein CVU34_03890 [Betaproteobacteria bacterium HGW-Betaproteobacteria-7]